MHNSFFRLNLKFYVGISSFGKVPMPKRPKVSKTSEISKSCSCTILEGFRDKTLLWIHFWGQNRKFPSESALPANFRRQNYRKWAKASEMPRSCYRTILDGFPGWSSMLNSFIEPYPNFCRKFHSRQPFDAEATGKWVKLTRCPRIVAEPYWRIGACKILYRINSLGQIKNLSRLSPNFRSFRKFCAHFPAISVSEVCRKQRFRQQSSDLTSEALCWIHLDEYSKWIFMMNSFWGTIPPI